MSYEKETRESPTAKNATRRPCDCQCADSSTKDKAPLAFTEPVAAGFSELPWVVEEEEELEEELEGEGVADELELAGS